MLMSYSCVGANVRRRLVVYKHYILCKGNFCDQFVGGLAPNYFDKPKPLNNREVTKPEALLLKSKG